MNCKSEFISVFRLAWNWSSGFGGFILARYLCLPANVALQASSSHLFELQFRFAFGRDRDRASGSERRSRSRPSRRRDERRRREEDEEEDEEDEEEDEEDEDEDETSAVSKGFQFDGISIRSISINSATFAPRIELSCINLVSFQLCNCVYLRANPSNPQHQA